jgi:pantoate--beta-alanine ligase
MKILPDITSLRQQRQQWQGSIGLVPTMGALHEGHATLVRQSVAENDTTVVSIFVNPTQFGPNEDFERYPRTMESDQKLLSDLGVDAIFAPLVSDIYPQSVSQIGFTVRDLDQVLDGASRPGHMNGVLQVVNILFNLVQPHRAYFGLKDYQQQLILQQMVRELHLPLQLIPCPVVRETDGLAMSSRNRYLASEEREQALFLSRALSRLKAMRGELRTASEARAEVEAMLADYPLVQLDYCEVLRGQDLQPLSQWAPEEHPVAFLAAFLGKTRLIDNMPVWEYPSQPV